MDNLTDFERKQYASSLGSKQMLPTASHFPRKKLKYRQRLAVRKELGDMAMSTMAFDVPSVEKLMKRPLATFIAITENDYGFIKA